MTHNTVFLRSANSKLGHSLQSMKGLEEGTSVPQKQPKAFDGAPGSEGREEFVGVTAWGCVAMTSSPAEGSGRSPAVERPVFLQVHSHASHFHHSIHALLHLGWFLLDA